MKECPTMARYLAALVPTELGDTRTVRVEGYMPLHITRLDVHTVSVSHTYEQNGDLMRDPEVVFHVPAPDAWFPIEVRMDPLGKCDRVAACAGGAWATAVKAQADLASFCTTWARNIKQQGFLEAAQEVRP